MCEIHLTLEEIKAAHRPAMRAHLHFLMLGLYNAGNEWVARRYQETEFRVQTYLDPYVCINKYGYDYPSVDGMIFLI